MGHKMKIHLKRRHIYLIEVVLLLLGALFTDFIMYDNQQNAIKRGDKILASNNSHKLSPRPKCAVTKNLKVTPLNSVSDVPILFLKD